MLANEFGQDCINRVPTKDDDGNTDSGRWKKLFKELWIQRNQVHLMPGGNPAHSYCYPASAIPREVRDIIPHPFPALIQIPQLLGQAPTPVLSPKLKFRLWKKDGRKLASTGPPYSWRSCRRREICACGASISSPGSLYGRSGKKKKKKM